MYFSITFSHEVRKPQLDTEILTRKQDVTALNARLIEISNRGHLKSQISGTLRT